MKDATERKHKREIILELYQNGDHTLREIGEMIGVSRQRVHQYLKTLSVSVRPPKLRHRKIDRDLLEQLYVNELKRVNEIVRAIGSSDKVVKRELKRHGIPMRPRSMSHQKPCELDGLRVGQSVTIECGSKKRYYSTLYSKAAARCIRISIRRVDPDHVRLKRLE